MEVPDQLHAMTTLHHTRSLQYCSTHSLRSWVDPRAGLDALEKEKKSLVHAWNCNIIPGPFRL